MTSPEVTLGLVYENQQHQFEQLFANQQEQARFQQEQARFQQEQFEEFKANVYARLERIEANTIVIKGRVISDFENIQPDTQSDLQEAATAVLDDEERLERCLAFVAGLANKKERQEAIRVGAVLKALDPTTKHGDKAACGNWVSNQLTKIFQTRFKGKYHSEFSDLISLLVLFWRAERDGFGRAY